MFDRGAREETERILSARYLEARAERDRRLEEVYRAHPRLAALDQELLERTQRALLALLGRPEEETSAREFENLDREREAYLKSQGLTEAYAELRPTCPRCGDLGIVDGAYCSCYRELLARFSAAPFEVDLPRQMTFQAFNLERFSDRPSAEGPSPRANMRELRELALAYVDGFGRLLDRNLYFYGPPGTGKTFLLSAIGQALRDKGVDVLYLSAPQLFDALQEVRHLRETYAPDAEKEALAQRRRELILTTPLLLLDDLGTEAPRPSLIGDFLDLLNVRENRRLHTIIASNLGFRELPDHYDLRVTSRLTAFSYFHFFGEDQRYKD